MSNKKVTKNKVVGDVPYEYQGFLTYMDYLATGEGRTIEINFCYANNEANAKEKHLDRFYEKDNSAARNYFGVGIEVFPIESKNAQDIIESFFASGKQLHEDLRSAGLEFHFKFHFNHS